MYYDLKAHLKSIGMTQYAFSKLVGCGDSTISRAVRGARVSKKTKHKICDVLGIEYKEEDWISDDFDAEQCGSGYLKRLDEAYVKDAIKLSSARDMVQVGDVLEIPVRIEIKGTPILSKATVLGVYRNFVLMECEAKSVNGNTIKFKRSYNLSDIRKLKNRKPGEHIVNLM